MLANSAGVLFGCVHRSCINPETVLIKYSFWLYYFCWSFARSIVYFSFAARVIPVVSLFVSSTQLIFVLPAFDRLRSQSTAKIRVCTPTSCILSYQMKVNKLIRERNIRTPPLRSASVVFNWDSRENKNKHYISWHTKQLLFRESGNVVFFGARFISILEPLKGSVCWAVVCGTGGAHFRLEWTNAVSSPQGTTVISL